MRKAITYLFAIFAMLGAYTSSANAQTYCTPTYTWGCSDGDGITSFALNTISETILCTTPPFQDHTSVSTDLTIGDTYVLSVSTGFGSNYFTLWIDFNNNYVFDAGEVVSSGALSSSGVVYTFSLVIPNTVAPSSTRMRIIGNYSVSPTAPCGSYTYGSGVDYTVNLLPLSDIDAGVTSITSPTSLENEAASIPVNVVIQNFGTLAMTAADVSYSLNGGTPVTFAWTGSLASGATAAVTLPNMTVPPGNNNICAWTTLVGDTIPQDDTTCMAFYGLPLWDAGVTAILAPGALELENTSISPQVTIKNFGVNTLTSMNILYTINSGAPVTFAWTGSLAPNTTTNATLPAFIVPGGFDTICAYTVLPLDGDATNDEKCFNFYADPQFDFAALSFLSPESYCGMGLEDVTVQFLNQGDTVYTFDMGYSYNGGTPVIETVTQTVYPGDTLTYTFTTQVDMTTTLYDVLYSFSVWSDVLGDPLLNNDTVHADVMAMHVPEDPIAQGDTIVYGTSADLIAFSIDTVNWYEVDTVGAPIIYTGPFFTTPVLLDTTTYWVNASTGMEEPGNLTTSWADDNGFTGNMFDLTAFTDLTIDSFEINGTSSALMEVWYRPGSCFGFNTSNVGWTFVGSYTVTSQGTGNPTSLPVGGIEIPAGETYGICVTYVTGSIRYITATATNQNYANADLEFQAQYGGGYFSFTNYPRVFSGNIFYTAGEAGCASNLVPVTAIVTNIPTQDAGVTGLSSPVDGIELSQTETVTIDVYNYGLEAIWDVPVSFSVDGGPLTTEIITDTIQPYATFTYTFTGTANLSAVMVHTIEACTSHPSDIYPFNDCMSFPVESQPLLYCTSSANSTAYEDLINVEIDTWSNYSGPAVGSMYSNFTNIPGPFLAKGATYPISITSDFSPGYSYNYGCWVKVFIDWNHDGIYDPATETAFSSTTLSSNTVTGTFTVPLTAVPAVSGMRVVFVETTSATSVNPCGTYSWGETEDYVAMIAPQIPNDGGVTEIITPGALEVENLPVPVVVKVRNFGTATLTAFDIGVEFNGGTPVITPWTGSIAPTMTQNITLPMVNPVGANNVICAYTIVPNDSNTFNDQTCKTFWATPQFEAGVTQIVHPESSGCGLGQEHITIRIKNYGDTINGAMLATYIFDGGAPVTEIVSTQILPGDSLDFAFAATEDFTVTTQNDTFDIVAFINLQGDPIPGNDTISGNVISLFTPDPPLVFGATVPYGSTAILTAQASAATYFYDDPAGSASGAPYLVANDTFITPILYDTTTYYVEASGAIFNNLQVGTGTNVSSVYDYPNPYQAWFYGNREQFLIRASELYALGYAGGEINSISFNAIAATPMVMTNFTIKIGQTSSTVLSGWESGLSQVYFNPAYFNTTGWNLHEFSAPFAWDGVSNIVIETCFNNTSYASGSQIQYSIVPFNASYNYHSDAAGVCSNTSSSSITQTWRPNMILNVLQLGCPSATIPVTATVTGIPAYDAGVTAILSPNSGIELTNEDLTVVIHNWGQNAIANFPVSYTINGGAPVTEILPFIMQSGDVVTYTFPTPLNLSVFGTYNICAYTSVLNDGWPSNDQTCKTVVNDPLVYCVSNALYAGYEEITNVGVDTWNNPSVSNGSNYTDFTGIPGPFLAIGNTYDISITTDYSPGYSYSYTCYVEVYIDYNHDGVFTEPDELAFGTTTSSVNTVTGTFTVPFTAVPSMGTGMRVVFRESGTASSVVPCGTYGYGETEDYLVMIAPLIPNDGGVTQIITPSALEVENLPVPVVVEVRNFGTDTLTAFDLKVDFNGNPSVITPWTGSIAPTMTEVITLPMVNPIGANNSICVSTIVTGDSNTFNDGTCKNFWATPEFEAGVTQIVHPESSGCGLGQEHITLRIMNYGNAINGTLTASYSVNGGPTVTENVTALIPPGDSLDFAFAATYDFSVTTLNDTFDIVASIDLIGDPIPGNDTIMGTVISLYTPVAPVVFNDTVPYGSTATLTAQSGAYLYWYDDPAGSSLGAPYVVANDTFITGILYDTTTVYVEASGAVFNNLQVGTGTSVTGTTSYPSPYQGFYEGNRNQFLIRASELYALGYVGGEINSISFNTIAASPMAMTNFTIKIGQTTATALSGWQSGLSQVYFNPSFSDVTGWNLHEFSTPFAWDGVSNVVIETCFNNSGYASGSQIQYSIVPFNASYNYHADNPTVCSSTASSSITQTWRPNMILNVLQLGCPSVTTPVTAVVTGIPDWDAGVSAILSPNSGIELTNEDVTVVIHNWGHNTITNFPVKYSINGGAPVTEIIPISMQTGDVYTYTFPLPANLTAFTTYNFMAWTDLANDGWPANDAATKVVVNDPLVYCVSNALYAGYEEITNVGIGTWNNPSVANGSNYTNYTGIPGPFLAVGNSHTISITTDFSPGYSYSYTCYVEVYIDYNHDGIFTEPGELAFGTTTTSSNTVTGTFTVPYNAVPSMGTGMRVVFVEYGNASSVVPCGTYSYGETEDYLVMIAPQIPNDAGVSQILQPLNNLIENFVSPVEVKVQNYGTDTIWAMDVFYTVDGGTPVSYAYTGPLAPAANEILTLPNLTIPGGFYNLCAYTVLAGDSNTFNDQTCLSLFAIPQFEAGMLSIDAPAGGCDLGLADVVVTFENYGDTIAIGNLELNYDHQLMAPVTEIYPSVVYPFDIITYTFTTQIDLAVAASTEFELLAWVDLVGDPIHTNDTADAAVWSGVTPPDPIVNDITIWSGTIGILTPTNLDTTLMYSWFDIDTNKIGDEFSYTSPALFDTTHLFVSSATGVAEANSLTTTWAGGNSFAGNMFDITAYTQLTIDSFDINGSTSGIAEVWYRPGSYSGFELSNAGWTMAGSYSVTSAGTGNPTRLPVGGITIPAGETYGIYVTYVSGTMTYTNGTGANQTYSNADFMFWGGHGGGYFALGNFPRVWNGNIYYTAGVAGCSSNLVPVNINVQYANYDAAVWAVTSPTSGAYLSLVDVTAQVYNNGLLPISNIPISYTWNGVLQASETILSTLQPGTSMIYTFTQQLNLTNLWGLHTICVTTALANDGYLLNNESCKTINNFDGDGLTCATAWQYGWVNDPAVYGATTFAYDEEWWTVEAPGAVTNAYFSLCNSSFDTKLEVYGNCTGYYLWYSDDNYAVCGTSGPSHIDRPLLSAGTYYVRVFGYSTNFGAYELEIGGEMPCFTLSGTTTNVSCNGQANGSIDLTVTNIIGTTPFSYSWSTGQTNQDLFGLAAGTYCVTVSDAANCSETACYTITEPTAVNLTVSGTDATTLGGQDGTIDLSAFGGVAPYSYIWSNGASTQDLAALYAGYYKVTVIDANGCSSVISIMINSPLPPGLPPPPTTNIHEIAVPSNTIVSLDASPVAYGSLLIVYRDSAGTMVPGGFTYWSGMASTLVAYGDDGTNSGFAAGEAFTWKLFDVASMDYYTGTVTYNTSYPNWSGLFVAGGSSGILGAEFLSIYTQNVPLPLGWSIFSTFINPLAPNIQAILAPVVSNIIIVKSGTGLVYWPQYFLNNIGNIIKGQGYQVKTNAATSANFVGYPWIPELNPLSLPNGWSILGYLRQTPMAIVPIMSNQGMVNPPFTPPGKLIIVKDDQGAIYWPQYGLDNIGTMDPGEGYQIKLGLTPPQTHFTFVYPMNSPNSSQSSKADIPVPVKYNHKVNTGNNMTIGIPESAWNRVPQEGDEIGVFNTEGTLVGATVYTGGHTAITVWGDDELTQKTDGALENTALTLSYFDAVTSVEQVIEVQKWESGNGNYAVNAIAVVGKLTISKTNSYALYQNMPNPFSTNTEIKFYLPESAVVNISVFNVLGERIEEIVSRNFEAGDHTIQFDANKLPSGNYYYKMTANDFVSTKPMHIVK